MNIDSLIKEKLGIETITSTDIYKEAEYRDQCGKTVIDLVNNYIDKIPYTHEVSLEEQLKTNGCVVLDNFMSEDEVDDIMASLKYVPGYNYHIAANSYNQEARVFSEDLLWNILSYKPDVLLGSKTILEKFSEEKTLSLIQSYLGCFPTLYSFNCIWSKFTGEEFKTQKIHRDYDDFKFLSLFVILTDIDDNNGPHVFYPKTQDGSEIDEEPFVIKGKKGTAFLADTYALHNGMPLLQGQRCLLWVRYGLYLNNIHFHCKSNLFAQDSADIFKHISETESNKYLLRAFIKNQD